MDYNEYMSSSSAPSLFMGDVGEILGNPEDILVGSDNVLTVIEETYMTVSFDTPVNVINLSVVVSGSDSFDVSLRSGSNTAYQDTVSVVPCMVLL